jgi:predicted enzyme related to lactoylglutathione lyase
MPLKTAASNATTSALRYEGGLHCDLRVVDLQRAVDFYCGTLGFEIQHHIPEVGWAELRSPVEGVAVGLTQVEKMPPRGGGAVLTFGVEDVDAARAQLEDIGVQFDGETCEIEGFVRLATLYDPDGNVLMLYQDLEQ